MLIVLGVLRVLIRAAIDFSLPIVFEHQSMENRCPFCSRNDFVHFVKRDKSESVMGIFSKLTRLLTNIFPSVL
jgi:hypothetical protein